jgi:hypothetical protein
MNDEQEHFPFLEESPPCPHPARTFKWRLLDTGGAHLGAWCRACGRWITWVPQDHAMLAQAPPRPRRGR